MEIVMYMCCWRRCSSALMHTLFRAYSSIASVSHLHCSPSSGLHTSVCVCLRVESQLNRASDISRKKNKISRYFQREIRGKIDRFRGKKVKIRGTISQFCRRKVKILRKIVRFRGILEEKSQFSNDFQGQIVRKIGQFHGKFREESSPRNNQ